MPANVRNFWIDGRVDGRSTDLSGGPRSKDGGISLNVLQRDKGRIVTAVSIEGHADGDDLVLEVVVAENAAPGVATRRTVFTTQR